MAKALAYFKNSHNLILISTGVLSLVISFLIAKVGVMMGIASILLVIALTVLLLVFTDYKNGYIILTIYCFSFFTMDRLLLIEFPWGVFVELMCGLLVIAIITRNFREGSSGGWDVYKNPVGYALLIYLVYAALEFANPYSTSIAARIQGFRETLMFVLLFFVSMHVFKTFEFIKSFTKFWLFLALILALHGLKQEYIGLYGWEWRWLNSLPEPPKLIWGHMQKWSLLSDSSAFGIFMAFSAVVSLILALGPFKTWIRVVLVISGILMILSMSYAGTRTAIAMLALGVGFYTLMSINNRRTLIFAMASAMVFLAIIFGPFYGGTFSRIRSTFNPSDDPSMYVRDEKRVRLQPYARTHPIGGGMNTAGHLGVRYEPWHPLAGEYDPDSGYLRIALERGWIGLALALGMFATFLIHGLKNYYVAYDDKVKIFYAAYMASFFSLTIAHFTQDAIEQKPIVIIVMASQALMVRLITFDKKHLERT